MMSFCVVPCSAARGAPCSSAMADRHADLADLALGERMIGVVAGLGGEIERDGETRLTFGQVLAVEGVGVPRRRMSRIGAEDPGLVTTWDAGHGCSNGARSLLQAAIVHRKIAGSNRLLGRDPPHQADDEQQHDGTDGEQVAHVTYLGE